MLSSKLITASSERILAWHVLIIMVDVCANIFKRKKHIFKNIQGSTQAQGKYIMVTFSKQRKINY